MLSATHDAALGALEALEQLSLSWGYVDGSLSEADAEAAISAALPSANQAAAVLLDDLVDAKLVRRFRAGQERRHRTRFAELVRLLVRSRQLFGNRPWRGAPTLVSDFRVDIRPRATPRADVDPMEVLNGIAAEAGLSAVGRAAWRALSQADRDFKLRRFQEDAARRLLCQSGEHGTVVTAGTGSGKTLAFYLPALTAISDGLLPGAHWTRALCIYPRQELLKDQLTEAHNLAQRAKSALTAAGRRGASLGALYAGTPWNAEPATLETCGWRRVPSGHVCPFIRCPACGSEMGWTNADPQAGTARLPCRRAGCAGLIDGEAVRLTRWSIRKRPPDLLFTTTEMLNQRLSDTKTRRLFGVGQPAGKRPQFILLDEVHTYAGTSGAQVALTLRRWRHLLGAPVRWVGLSATLRDAPSFFSELTGLWQDAIAEASPRPDDMDHAGAEYQLVLRGDPSSQAATLSTSIQASMLLARMLDPPGAAPSEGRFGRRLFAFTDDLDVTHRLFDDLRDAEAHDRFGRPNNNRTPLAALRSGNLPELEARESDGKRWALAEDLRGSLNSRLAVGRTTSRDPGVDGRADVIVATAALEVGFNDPDVGAVLQHKAPRSFAAFLQRRGRAGRRAGMRPITVTVLSDYGRDRLAFQSYERLLDPTVERQALPVRNAYVLRMQAAFSLMDWIAARACAAGQQGWAWRTLSGPLNAVGSADGFRREAQALVMALMRLDDGVVDSLSAHLRVALRLTDDEVRAVLWDPPRPLLLEAVPTLARRLFRDWRLADGTGLDRMVDNHPLPDFIPRTLFSDLNLPEVHVDVPAATVNSGPKVEMMPVLQALGQFAPGRVRRRFADEYAGLAHWMPVPEEADATIAIADYAPEREFVGEFESGPHAVRVYRPWRITVQRPPAHVLPTSHGVWDWQSGFDCHGDPLGVRLPKHSAWVEVAPRLEFYLHRFSAAVSQRRFASTGRAEIRRQQGATLVRFRLADMDGHPAAVGFAYEADALRLPLRLPDAVALAAQPLAPELDSWLRTLRLRRAVARDAALPEEINTFQRDWLHQVLLLATARQAMRDGTGFADAAERLAASADPAAFRPSLAALVSAELLEDDEAGHGSRLEDTLDGALSLPGVIGRLCALAAETARLAGPDWGEWRAELLRSTVAEAALQACLIAAPANTALDGLTVDLDACDGGLAVLVVEGTLGGGGTMEALAHGFGAEPRAFGKAMDAALAPSDLETAAAGLQAIVRWAVGDRAIGAALAALRSAPDAAARTRARDALGGVLAEKGLQPSRALWVMIGSRLLRPGASAATDALVADLLDLWDWAEQACGIVLPVRVAAALCAADPGLRPRLAAAVGAAGSEVGAANLLLWPRGGEVRLGALQSHNPFRPAVLTDAALARATLTDGRVPVVRLSDADWHVRLSEALAQGGEARLVAAPDDAGRLRREIVRLLAAPIMADYLRLYACVDGMTRLPDGGVAADITVRERA